jgi:hypothetical protein
MVIKMAEAITNPGLLLVLSMVSGWITSCSCVAVARRMVNIIPMRFALLHQCRSLQGGRSFLLHQEEYQIFKLLVSHAIPEVYRHYIRVSFNHKHPGEEDRLTNVFLSG